MQHKELDQHIKDIAIMVSQQQGLQFDSEQEAQQHISQTTTKLQSMLKQSSAMFLEGLKYVADSNQPPASEIARSLIQNVKYPDRMTRIIETRIVQDPDSLAHFSEVVNHYYGCGDFHREECMISVLLTLFPLEPQPFACYGTLIWRKDGIAEAQRFYQHIVDLFESPILDYFAADCFFKAGNKTEAKRLLERGLENGNKEPELYSDILQFIRVMIREV